MPDLGGGTDDPSGFGFAKSFPLRAGVLLIAETALISFLSAASLLWVTVSRAIILRRRARLSHDEDPPMQPVSILFLFAIFMDSIQALGSILDIRWAFLGQVVEGRYCTTQAALKQLGNDGTAWFTIAIALMTFVQVVYPTLLTPKRARQVTYAAIGFIYLFLFLIIAIPSITIDHYYGNTGLWCWIAGSNTESLRLRVGERSLISYLSIRPYYIGPRGNTIQHAVFG
ncbi:hypothetical protein DL93DRAFT_299721 [Clavulina sp. PMI_390]|nr:hypothetical protein DL93DRAFT_299721 [Clavulina sp. PMI_390]